MSEMPAPRRKLARALAFALFLLALATTAGAGLLVLERYGFVTLGRVPNVYLVVLCEGRPGRQQFGCAIVNADDTPGCFSLGSPDNSVSPERVWVPSRSVVLVSSTD